MQKSPASTGAHTHRPLPGALKSTLPPRPFASPVPFALVASGTVPMRDVEVWVDGSKCAEQVDDFSNYTFPNKSVSLNPGTHNVNVPPVGINPSANLQKC